MKRFLFRFLARVLCTALLLSAAVSAVVLSVEAHVSEVVNERVITKPKLPDAALVVVPGASVINNERPSSVLASRLDTAIDLYHSGNAVTLLMSGDGRTVTYDETEVMSAYAQSRDVLKKDIQKDKEGIRTIETCKNLKGTKESVVLVTQELHLKRSMYLCMKRGLDVHGVVAPAPEGEILQELELRERFALVLAWVESGFK